MLSKYLTPDDLAKSFDEGGYAIAKPTQAAMRSKKLIPYIKLSGRFIRYNREAIDKWMEDHAVPSAS